MLDDMRFYNRIITATDVKAIYNLGTTTLNASRNNRLTNGLVGQWSFDGKDMVRNVADTSGQTNHGFLVSFPATSSVVLQGKIGQALMFSGSNYVNVGNASILDYGSTNSFSASAWFKTSDVVSTQVILGKKQTSGTAAGYMMRVTSSALQIIIGDGTNTVTANSASTLLPNTWYQGVIVLNRATNLASVYINGVLSGTPQSISVVGSLSNALAFRIGAVNNNVTSWGGSLDDVRVYNRVITQAEITTLYNLGTASLSANTQPRSMTDGLIGYWTFNGPDISATTATDKSGSGNNGTLTSFPSTLASVITAGKSGQALVFDGTATNIDLNDTNEPGAITLAAWVKPSLVKGGMKIVSKKMSGSSAQYGLATSISNTDKFTSSFYSSAPSSDVCESSGTDGTYSANQWYFVVATYDGDTSKMYVNGLDTTSVLSDIASGSILNGTSKLRIGADGGASILAGSYFSGGIDEVRIYSRALSVSEIQRLYNLGR